MNIRIIVAEDNDVLLEDLCQELNGQPDFQVVATTSSGVGAVEAALAMEFDVILLDIEMETIQAGIDAAAAIHPQKPEAKIIYLTAHDTDRMILKKLHARKIFIAQRFTDHVGGFRISCSWVNNREDIDNMIEAVKEIIASIGKAPDYKG